MRSAVPTRVAPGDEVSSPSGRQFEIAHGDHRAVVVEVGGGLRTYTVGGRDVLDGYAPDEPATAARGQLLIPWPNRLQDGRYEFDGRRHQLPLTEPEHRNAIHGLVRWAAWAVAERTADGVVMSHVIHPQRGYPFTVSLAVEYALSGAGLSVRTTATNAGTSACPFGAGAHPYLTLGSPRVDTLSLRVPAGEVLLCDSRGLPVGTEPVLGTAYDFTERREIGGTVLDNAFTSLTRDGDGRARVVLGDPGGHELTLWVDEGYPYLMVFTGDPLPEVDRRSISIEPMTCPPNAFRTADSLIRLEPGESVSASWGIEVR